MTAAGVPDELASQLEDEFPDAYRAGRDHVDRCAVEALAMPPLAAARQTLAHYLERGERFEAAWWLGVLDQVSRIERDEDQAILTGETEIARPFAITLDVGSALPAWPDRLRTWAEAIHR